MRTRFRLFHDVIDSFVSWAPQSVSSVHNAKHSRLIFFCRPFDRCDGTGPSFFYWFWRWYPPLTSLSFWLRHSWFVILWYHLRFSGIWQHFISNARYLSSSLMPIVYVSFASSKTLNTHSKDSQLRCERYVPIFSDFLQSIQRPKSLTYSVIYILDNFYPIWWCFLSTQNSSVFSMSMPSTVTWISHSLSSETVVLVFPTFIWRSDALANSFILCRLVCSLSSDVSKRSFSSANRKLLTD